MYAKGGFADLQVFTSCTSSAPTRHHHHMHVCFSIVCNPRAAEVSVIHHCHFVTMIKDKITTTTLQLLSMAVNEACPVRLAWKVGTVGTGIRAPSFLSNLVNNKHPSLLAQQRTFWERSMQPTLTPSYS